MSGRQLYAAYRFSMRAHAYIHIPEWDDLADVKKMPEWHDLADVKKMPEWDDLADVKKAAWNDLASNVVWAPGARPPA